MVGQALGRMMAMAVALTILAAACTARSDEPTETAGHPDRSTVVTPPTTESPRYRSEVYDDPDHWLCLPDRPGDACDVNLSVTVVGRDGSRRVEPTAADPAAPIDCFYVYPTVSDAETANSGLLPTDAEVRVVRAQAVQLQASCRLYAPMYRQITRAALFGQADGIPDRGLAFADVVDAWRHYLAHDNDGRGVVLVGHSQGAGHLRELLTRHIDDEPEIRARLVSAVLLGTTVRTPRDAPVGVHFDHLPPCTAPTQTGCIISYSTYPHDAPPGESGFFAGVRDAPDERAVCTNPAALGGGPALLDTIVPALGSRDGDVETRWVRYVGLAEAECVEVGAYHYLEIRYTSSDDDAWPAELGGRLTPQWGLHIIDANLALGDLVALIAEQGRAHALAP